MTENDQIVPITVSADLTETGVKASIMSRAISAWDRYWGATADRRRAPIDADIAEANAISGARVKMIDALGDLGVERLKSDPSFAARAVDNFLPSLMRKQENKDAILELTADDLRQNPGSEQEASSGPEKLSEEFLNRWERYAEDATGDEVRQRWAKVLASEIRQPGTFSAKVLRVIDEMDQPTAHLFERICASRLQNVIIKTLAIELSFSEKVQLVSAGLMVEPGLGQIQKCAETTDSKGTDLWIWKFDELMLAATKAGPIEAVENVIRVDGSSPALPVYVLTDVGAAIGSIMKSDTRSAVFALASKVSEALKASEVRIYAPVAGSTQLSAIATIPPKAPAAA